MTVRKLSLRRNDLEWGVGWTGQEVKRSEGKRQSTLANVEALGSVGRSQKLGLPSSLCRGWPPCWLGSPSSRVTAEGCLGLQPGRWEPLKVVILGWDTKAMFSRVLFHVVQKRRALSDISFSLLLPYLVSFSLHFYGRSVILICFP